MLQQALVLYQEHEGASDFCASGTCEPQSMPQRGGDVGEPGESQSMLQRGGQVSVTGEPQRAAQLGGVRVRQVNLRLCLSERGV